jgi:hypothetical protein
MRVSILKKVEINGVEYKKGDSLKVSQSIYNRLVKGKYAEDYKEPKKDKPKKDDK